MGYRLTVEKVGDKEPKYYGTKLYGYCDEEKTKSYQWLIKNNYLNKNEHYYWHDCSDNAILMRAEQFREFAKLYQEDLKDRYETSENLFIEDKDIQAFMNLNDWELIVISWG